MDADGTIQLLLGRPALHSCAEALSHLAGIWTQVVEPNNSVLRRAGVTAANIIDQTRSFYQIRTAENCETNLRCLVYCR